MAQSQIEKPVAPKRRFVLADKFSPKARHTIEKTESRAFGSAIPTVRAVERSTKATADENLQDSIRSILASS